MRESWGYSVFVDPVTCHGETDELERQRTVRTNKSLMPPFTFYEVMKRVLKKRGDNGHPKLLLLCKI